jgi:hypothetical protein
LNESVGLSPERLKRLRWKGEAAYRVLSYYFTVRWNWTAAGDYVRHVLGSFAVPPDPDEDRNPPTPGMPPSYSLVDLGRRSEARYGVLYGEAPMARSTEPANVVSRFFWHVNDEAVRRTGDYVLIHAGSLVTPTGKGLLILGAPGSGKTTLTGGLVRAGFAYLSDEAGAIDPVSRRLYPYPKALTVKVGRSELFPELSRTNGSPLLTRERHLRPEDIGPGRLGAPCDVGFVIAHRHADGSSAEATPLTPAEAVVELVANTMNMATYRGRALPLLADLARRARSYRLVSGALDEAVEVVARLTRSRLSRERRG